MSSLPVRALESSGTRLRVDPWCTAEGWRTGSVKIINQAITHAAHLSKGGYAYQLSPKLYLDQKGIRHGFLAKCPAPWPEDCLQQRRGDDCQRASGKDDSAFAEVVSFHVDQAMGLRRVPRTCGVRIPISIVRQIRFLHNLDGTTPPSGQLRVLHIQHALDERFVRDGVLTCSVSELLPRVTRIGLSDNLPPSQLVTPNPNARSELMMLRSFDFVIGNPDRFSRLHVGHNLFWQRNQIQFLNIDQGKALGWLVRALVKHKGDTSREAHLQTFMMTLRQELRLPESDSRRQALLESVLENRSQLKVAALFASNESCYFTSAFRTHLRSLNSEFAGKLGSRLHTDSYLKVSLSPQQSSAMVGHLTGRVSLLARHADACSSGK